MAFAGWKDKIKPFRLGAVGVQPTLSMVTGLS